MCPEPWLPTVLCRLIRGGGSQKSSPQLLQPVAILSPRQAHFQIPEIARRKISQLLIRSFDIAHAEIFCISYACKGLGIHVGLTEDQQKFIRLHCMLDMSPFQLAIFFGCEQAEITQAAKAMGLTIKRENVRLTAFHTPYEPQIGKSAKLFNWSNYYSEVPENGKAQIHSTDP